MYNYPINWKTITGLTITGLIYIVSWDEAGVAQSIADLTENAVIPGTPLKFSELLHQQCVITSPRRSPKSRQVWAGAIAAMLARWRDERRPPRPPFASSAGLTPTISVERPVNKAPSGIPPRVASMKRLTVCPRRRGFAAPWSSELAEVLLTVIDAPAKIISAGTPQNHGTSAMNVTTRP